MNKKTQLKAGLSKDVPRIACLITQFDVDRFGFPKELAGKVVSELAGWWSKYTGVERKTINCRKFSEHKDRDEGRVHRSERMIVGLEPLERRANYRTKKKEAPITLTEKEKAINSWFSRAM